MNPIPRPIYFTSNQNAVPQYLKYRIFLKNVQVASFAHKIINPYVYKASKAMWALSKLLFTGFNYCLYATCRRVSSPCGKKQEGEQKKNNLDHTSHL